MTDNYLKSLINKLNKGQTNGLIFIRPLSNTVNLAKVWRNELKKTDDINVDDSPYTCYFIKNNLGVYVSIVVDLINDLHWFTLPRHRKQNYLTNALKEIIIFHLFQNREEQRITMNRGFLGENNMLASQGVAKKIGFIETNNKDSITEYILKKNKYHTEEIILGTDTTMSELRIKEIKKHFNFLSRSILLIQSEIEMYHGETEYSDELIELADEISKHCSHKIEDAHWQHKRETNTH